MNTAVLSGFASQLEREEEITAEEFETKCARYGVIGGFISAPNARILCVAGQDTVTRYEASVRGEEGAETDRFYSFPFQQ